MSQSQHLSHLQHLTQRLGSPRPCALRCGADLVHNIGRDGLGHREQPLKPADSLMIRQELRQLIAGQPQRLIGHQYASGSSRASSRAKLT